MSSDRLAEGYHRNDTPIHILTSYTTILEVGLTSVLMGSRHSLCMDHMLKPPCTPKLELCAAPKLGVNGLERGSYHYGKPTLN